MLPSMYTYSCSWYQQWDLIVIAAIVKASAFAFADGCASYTSPVAFAHPVTSFDAAAVQKN